MKLLKSERELGEHDFRLAGGGNKKILCSLIGPHEQSEGVIVQLGVGLPDNARTKVYLPKAKNLSLIQTINDNEELVEGSVLSIEWLKDNSEGEGEFEVFLDEERSPKSEAPTE